MRKLRESGLSKRQAKRVIHARPSQQPGGPAPVAEYRRLARIKRARRAENGQAQTPDAS